MRLPPARNNRKLPPAVSPPSAGETASDAAGAKTGAGPRATGPGWQEAVEQGTAGPGNIVYNAKARPDLNGIAAKLVCYDEARGKWAVQFGGEGPEVL